MPFQSDKQRRWMYANEPEIAREWSDRYGAANGGIMDWVGQGGMKNYLGEQEMVNAPQHWRSGPDSPSTELAYITQPEKDLMLQANLHGSLGQGPNEGPSGIMSLDGWGSTDPGQNVSGTAASAAETGSRNARDRAEVRAQFTPSGSPTLPPGVTPQGALDFRAAAINAGAGQRVNPGFFDSRTRISPYERALAKAYRQDPKNRFAKKAYRKTGQGGLMSFLTSGGLIGNLIRGLGQKFGLGKRWNEPTHDMSQLNKLTLGGMDPFANLDIRDKWDRRQTQEGDTNIGETLTDMNEVATEPEQIGESTDIFTPPAYEEFGPDIPAYEEFAPNNSGIPTLNNDNLNDILSNALMASTQQYLPGLGPTVNTGDPYKDNIYKKRIT